jgi:hypothetical protein
MCDELLLTPDIQHSKQSFPAITCWLAQERILATEFLAADGTVGEQRLPPDYGVRRRT